MKGLLKLNDPHIRSSGFLGLYGTKGLGAPCWVLAYGEWVNFVCPMGASGPF